jgi:DNA-binding MarR family transcriptional regulator
METLQVPGDLIAAIRNIRRLDFSKQIGGITEREYFFLRILDYLSSKLGSEPVYVSSIVSELDISGPAVSKMLKNLEEKQLISRRTDASDRRNTVVALTDKGRKVKAQADEIAACFFSKVTEKFGKDNLDKLKTLLTQFYRAVAEVSADFDFDIKTELPSGDSAE